MHLTFFDLDQTLLATDSDYEWNRFLVDTGWVEAADYAAANERFAGQYAEGTLDIHEYQRFALGPLMTHGHETMASLRERFVAERIAPHIAPHARGVLAYHRQRGDLIAIITATNAFVTAPIADLLAVDHLIAVEPERIDGRYTGNIAGVPSFQAGKIERAKAFLAEHAGPAIDGVTFYSDSHNDIPLLEWADRPVAVDPDERLAARARAEGWSIVSFRAAEPPALV
ncbi:HAD family hydrolase [Salinisphaera japonica]|uniref:Phosphoserine phosphatase n=1 Tax=Salinisphaera japonica YTM-1 TaxID=1209778 RepID=A0A423PTP3_9GAMM|nr:HAD family hydrolase [Salinisphaera japonica]ROO28954.1 phosphoserine phosphatase [Salinisphaera japonica YTM-1]